MEQIVKFTTITLSSLCRQSRMEKLLSLTPLLQNFCTSAAHSLLDDILIFDGFLGLRGILPRLCKASPPGKWLFAAGTPNWLWAWLSITFPAPTPAPTPPGFTGNPRPTFPCPKFDCTTGFRNGGFIAAAPAFRSASPAPTPTPGCFSTFGFWGLFKVLSPGTTALLTLYSTLSESCWSSVFLSWLLEEMSTRNNKVSRKYTTRRRQAAMLEVWDYFQ